MKPISIRILNDFSDSFFYMGKLFVLTEDKQLKFIDNDKIFKEYLQNGNALINHWLKKIFFNNDTLPNYQDFRNEANGANEFNSFWGMMENQKIEFHIKDDHLTFICDIPENESLDFIIYAERAYLANRDGLFECRLNINGENVTSTPDGFQRVFDSKSIYLNPRAGKVLVSTKSDGLFAGSIENQNDNLNINENHLSPNSIRASWAEYNFVNYKSSTEGDFFLNETEEIAIDGINFTVDDGSSQNRKIKEIGKEQISLSDMFTTRTKREKLIFSFNSLSNSFNISETGHIYYNKLDKNAPINILTGITLDLKRLGYPLSAHTVARGTIYEFFNQVTLVRNGIIETVSEIECKQIRTFASSKWFKNTIMALSEEYLEIHSIHPYH
ncbi:hypothetical protein [uncultured Sphingobacterium sp.]|uniref:hypothetical protein n=1 Tax=uncultured Sphingobacterium sp. TaxID=182688 RepID=UPI0025D21D7E|nr:hypothetical protein [uncultured Sphingobacterium sp.]